MCHHYRISHSEFLSWDKGDRDKALWMMHRKASTCGGCGTRAEEWDPDKDGDRAAHLPSEYVCPGCARLEERRTWLSKQEHLPAGLHLRLVPRDHK